MRPEGHTFPTPSLHETFRNASVTRPTQPAVPLARPIECRPVDGRASGVPLYTYINKWHF